MKKEPKTFTPPPGEKLDGMFVLLDLSAGFEKMQGDAERLAHGEKAECDLSPGGWLVRQAKRAERLGGALLEDWHGAAGFDYSSPATEFSRVLNDLRELVQDGVTAGNALKLAADCRVNHAVACMLADGIWNMEILRMTAAAQVAEAKAREEDAKAAMHDARGRAKEAKEAAKRAEEERREAEAKRREAEIAVARLEEHKHQARGVRGKNISPDVKKAVLDWMDKEYPGGVRGEGWQAAFESLTRSKDYTPRIQQHIGSAAALARVVEAARVDAKRKSHKTRRQKK